MNASLRVESLRLGDLEPGGRRPEVVMRGLGSRVCERLFATRVRVVLLASITTGGFAGCTTGPQGCTLIGCSDGIAIDIDGIVSAQVTVEILVDGVVVGQTLCATSQGNCLVVLEDFVPDELTVRVTGVDSSAEETFTPTYMENQPNGPDCPPICLQALIEMTAVV